jgi:ParB-like chromosome segregation protein Spo0J
VTTAGNKVPVILRQSEEGGSWEIVDGRRQERVATLAPEQEGPLTSVILSIKEQLEQK